MCTIFLTDLAYTVGTLQISIPFDTDSQSLAGGIFIVAARLGTSIALAVSSSVATAVLRSYRARRPQLSRRDPDILLASVRAAGGLGELHAGRRRVRGMRYRRPRAWVNRRREGRRTAQVCVCVPRGPSTTSRSSPPRRSRASSPIGVRDRRSAAGII